MPSQSHVPSKGTQQDDAESDEPAAPPFGPEQPGSRSLRVRLIALLLLLGVTAITFDFSGLLREAADGSGPLAARNVTIDADSLEPHLGLRGHGIEVIDGQTFVVIRLEWNNPSTGDPDTVPPKLRAVLSDADGSSLGWQLLAPSPGPQAGAKRGPTYRLQLPEGVRPAKVDLRIAD